MPSNAAVNVFTYGSLMFDQVWRAVVGRLNPSVTGRLDGFEAWKLAGQTFPGMAPAPGRQVRGRIWQEVTHDEVARLDAFESGIYDRKALNLQTDDGVQIEAWAYIVRPDCRGMFLDEPWDSEEFQRRHLPTFLSAEFDETE